MHKYTKLKILDKIGTEELGNGWYIDFNEFSNLYD